MSNTVLFRHLILLAGPIGCHSPTDPSPTDSASTLPLFTPVDGWFQLSDGGGKNISQGVVGEYYDYDWFSAAGKFAAPVDIGTAFVNPAGACGVNESVTDRPPNEDIGEYLTLSIGTANVRLRRDNPNPETIDYWWYASGTDRDPDGLDIPGTMIRWDQLSESLAIPDRVPDPPLAMAFLEQLYFEGSASLEWAAPATPGSWLVVYASFDGPNGIRFAHCPHPDEGTLSFALEPWGWTQGAAVYNVGLTRTAGVLAHRGEGEQWQFNVTEDYVIWSDL